MSASVSFKVFELDYPCLQFLIQMEKTTGDATLLLIIAVSDSGTTVQTFLILYLKY